MFAIFCFVLELDQSVTKRDPSQERKQSTKELLPAPAALQQKNEGPKNQRLTVVLFKIPDVNASFGGRFTWTTSQNPPILIRLYRFLLSPDFQDHCPAPMQVQLDNLELTIDFLDNLEEVNVLDDEDVVAREQAKIKHAEVSMTLDRRIDQREKERWMKDGESNSSYLHKLASFKYKNNSINCSKIEVNLCFDKKKIADETKRFYSSLFTEQFSARPSFENLEMHTISVSESINLEKPFSEEEVKEVVDNFGANKSPGPDGFTMEFYKIGWKVIKNDLMKVVKEFETSSVLDWRVNCINITLIPKCGGAVSLHNFRPISLIGSIYKVISKHLSERLKVVLPSIISEFQGDFVHGRKIQDGMLIASKLIDSKLRQMESGLVCKVDFEKAFDNVNWGCVETVLARFGFGCKWRSWIKWCITTPRFDDLLKGEATDLFKSQKGIRQGDPVSHFLFILVAEVLSLMFKKEAAQGLITGFKVAQQVSFETISGLKVNFRKSTIVGLGQMHNGEFCAYLFGCSSKNFPMNYLGIPLGSKSKCKNMPVSVVKEMERIIRNFLWGSSTSVKKRSWVSWTRVNLPKSRGGAGIKKLHLWDGILKSRDSVKTGTSLIVGNGSSIYFWNGVWVGEQSLEVLFPTLFHLSKKKNAVIKDLISPEGA
ncbi:uncharacterized protein LOC113291135 [Papaver somniferum]|uniref:uncharacterized protein LOC113291135 n=1 Tax=Papaver somniferum TaxID=3469 RepID=UPI000E70160A|nr:uncharacterized protein LOC113291135 [Papaver somniferum]